jgi:hypothetical protein
MVAIRLHHDAVAATRVPFAVVPGEQVRQLRAAALAQADGTGSVARMMSAHDDARAAGAGAICPC